ncbi:MAG: hypothetical protein HC865_22815 [Cyanobacteria bacterium RU_5_0]|nr:hypothetical protein [Cyanobacteria bacterium RU_5_0]
MSQRYLNVARQGKNRWWRYLLGILLTFILWQIVGGLTAGLILVIVFFAANGSAIFSSPSLLQQQLEAFIQTASIQAFAILNLPFISCL